MKLIYIGHPLGGTGAGKGCEDWKDGEKNFQRYLAFCAMFTNAGHSIVSWAHHWLMHSRGLTQGGHGFYMQRDLALLRISDLFVQAGPLSVSSGLTEERDFCKGNDIPTYSRVAWMNPDFLPDPKEDPRLVNRWIDNALHGKEFAAEKGRRK